MLCLEKLHIVHLFNTNRLHLENISLDATETGKTILLNQLGLEEFLIHIVK